MLARLAKQSGLYALVSVAAKLSGVALLALYGDPAVLPRADFGVLGGIDAVRMLALLIAGAGLPMGILRFATAAALPDAERAAVPATAFVLAAALGAIAGLIGWLSAPWLAATFLGSAAYAEAVRWTAVYVALRALADVPYTQLRADERAGAYALAGAFEALALVAAVSYFLVAKGEGLAGVTKGYALSAGLVAVVLTPLAFGRASSRLAWRPSAALVRPLLAFGLPLVLSGLAARFLNVGDRLLLLKYLPAGEVAVYEWAARFGGVVNVFLVQSFQMAFTVLGLKALDASGQPDLHRRAFRHFAALAGGTVLGLGLFVGDVSRLLTDEPDFLAVGGLALLIGGGFAFYGLYVVVVNVLYAEGKTRLVALGVAVAALGNAGLNVLLIPRLGVSGAAVATLAAYAGLAVWTAGRAERIVRAGYPWRAVAAATAVVGALWLASVPTDGWPLVARLAARVGLLAAYGPLLYATGVYRREDVDVLRRLVADRWPGRDGSRPGIGSTPPTLESTAGADGSTEATAGASVRPPPEPPGAPSR